MILKNIFSHDIGKLLAFKWGTLAYLIHNLDRFSTDIDLDILDISQEQAILQSMREILVMIWDIKNETLGQNLHRWIFRYDDKSMNIKIELNKRIFKTNTYHIQNIAETKILCMTPDSMFANKLLALSERLYNRDLYDVHFFFKNNFPFNQEIIIERSGLTTDKFFTQLLKKLPSHFKESTILAGLGEVLDEKQKLWVKKSLLEETLEKIKKHC